MSTGDFEHGLAGNMGVEIKVFMEDWKLWGV